MTQERRKAPPAELTCPECGTENVAVLAFEGEATKFICDECEHEWTEGSE